MLIVLAVFSQTKSNAQLLLHETFSYPLPGYIGGNGNAGSTSNNWTTHSVTPGQTSTDTLVAGSLSYTGLEASVGNKLRLFSFGNTLSRDVNTPLLATTASVCYYSLLVNIVDNTQLSATAPDHFFGFSATAGMSATSFGARLAAKSVNAGANYRFSLLNASTGASTYTDFAQDLNFGTTYLVVVKFDKSAVPTMASLWVDPVSTSFGGTEPAGAVTNNINTGAFAAFAAVYLRNGAGTPKAEIDEIRVGETWADVTPVPAGSVPVTSVSVAGLAGATTITTNAGTLQMVETVLPVNATDPSVSWSVTPGTGTATISPTGLLTAITNGDVTVRATANDGTNIFGETIITLSNQNIPVTGITVTGFGGATTITTLAGTLQMSAAILPLNATDQSVTWSVINGTGQATISLAGLLTAVADGIVTVKATANDGSGVFGTLNITISNQAPVVLVSSIVVTGTGGATVITTNGGTLQMLANVLPVNATNPTYTWSVTPGTGTATISPTGLLTAVTNGIVTVVATANDASGVTGTLNITISNQIVLVTNITVTGFGGATTISTYAGTLQMSAAILPITATDQTVTWSVINGTGQGTIDPAGLLTAVADGIVTVKATANDGSGVFGTLDITLSNQTILVTSILVTGDLGATTISTPGGTLQMSAAVLPVNATNSTYTWSVTNGTGQGTINVAGLLTAVTDGIVTVKATANDGSGVFGTLDITITNQPIPPSELLYEPFNYLIGDSLVPHNWLGVNSGDQVFVTAGSLNYPNLAASIGEKISFNGIGRDFQRTFTSQTAGTVYYSFIMQVTDLALLDTLNGGYFSGLAGSSTLFGASIWTKKAGADYIIGLNPRTTLANTIWSSISSPINTPVFVVVSYELVAGTANDVINMWINPAAATFGAATAPTPTLTSTNAGTDLTAVDRIFIRQDSDTETPFIDQDELRVGLDWATVTPFTVGVAVVENKSNEIKVYPNPTNGMININSGNQNQKEIRVYSANGSLIYKTTSNNVSEVINLSDRSAGLYMIQVADQITGKQSNIKVQIQ